MDKRDDTNILFEPINMRCELIFLTKISQYEQSELIKQQLIKEFSIIKVDINKNSQQFRIAFVEKDAETPLINRVLCLSEYIRYIIIIITFSVSAFKFMLSIDEDDKREKHLTQYSSVCIDY